MKGLLNKTTIVVAITGLLIGRFAFPKVIIKEVIKIVEVTKQQTKKKKTVTETTSPDGTSTTQTTETDDSTTESNTTIASTTTTKSKQGISLGVLAIKDLNSFSSPFQYGATISVPLAGSLSVTGLATTSKQIGVGLSIEF
jgi:hypothetical protein